MNHRLAIALVASIGATLVSAPVALALNEFSASITNAVGPVYDGLKGNMNIRTDPATDPDVTYAHITQADVGSPGGTFVAIGTYNGKAIDNCAANVDPQWSGYYDGEIGGLYFCEDFDRNLYGAGSNPNFKIEYETGALCGGNRWILTFNGGTRACLVTSASSAQHLNIGLETQSTPSDPTDRNIDVKYTSLYRNQTNGTDWIPLGQPAPSDYVISDFYSASWVSNTAQSFYLAPLN